MLKKVKSHIGMKGGGQGQKSTKKLLCIISMALRPNVVPNNWIDISWIIKTFNWKLVKILNINELNLLLTEKMKIIITDTSSNVYLKSPSSISAATWNSKVYKNATLSINQNVTSCQIVCDLEPNNNCNLVVFQVNKSNRIWVKNEMI